MKGVKMAEDFNNVFKCDPSDCASCQGCQGSDKTGGHSTITLTLDDDTEVTCTILTVFPVGKKQYIALLPVDEEGQAASSDVYLYTYDMTDSGDPMLANIEDDEEYDKAVDAFNSILENARTVAEAEPPQE